MANPFIREIFRWGILANAVSVICIHSHPSGDKKPSTDDTKFTQKLVEAGKTIDIKVLDHLIVGDGYFSFAESGLL
jgi:DNA repair protein RadC